MLENIRDRGTKKWAMAMMLPEHIEELRNWMDKDHFIERPELTDWDLQAIQEEIEVASKRKCEVLVKSWGKGKINIHGGIMKEINLQSRSIMIDSPFGIVRIPVSDIIAVQIAE